MAEKSPTSTKKYSWVLGPEGCVCTPDNSGLQTIKKLWEVEAAQPFHDQALMIATLRINELLEEAAKKAPDEKRDLCFIGFGDRLMLVWSETRPGLTKDDDPETVAKALGIEQAWKKARKQDEEEAT
jgi:hypothetical protein